MMSFRTDRQRQASANLIAYFGYGSLVCRHTHRTEIVDARPARLTGWRRCWRPRPDMPGFPAALLSVRPEPDAVCDGLLVIDRVENLPQVDAREARYNRIELDREAVRLDGDLPHGCPVFLYVADDTIPPHPEPPLILQSYLDAVMLGFLQEHGKEGLQRFVAETDGFDTAMHADREGPLYPRAVMLEPATAGLFDRILNERL